MKRNLIMLAVLIGIVMNHSFSFGQEVWNATNGPWYNDTLKLCISALSINGNNDLYAGVDNFWGQGIRKSTDNGNTWFNISANLTVNSKVNSIGLALNGDVYAGLEHSSTGPTIYGLYKKNNGDTTWNAMTSFNNDYGVKKIVIKSNGTIFVLGVSNNKMFRSTDNGSGWTEINNGMPGSFENKTFALTTDGTLYRSTTAGVYKSVNDGDTWTASATTSGVMVGYNLVECMAAGPGGIVYAAVTNGVQGLIYKSTDGGSTWNALSATGLTQVGFRAMAVTSDGKLFATAANTGARSSKLFMYDGVSSWIDKTSGLPGDPANPGHTAICRDLAVNTGGYMFAALNTYGVYKTINTVIHINESYSAPKSFGLNNYPNPFNPSTTIEFTLAENSFVSLKIYNAMGQEVETLISQKMNAGPHHIQWNAGHLSSGVYYYQLSASGNSKTKKLLLIK